MNQDTPPHGIPLNRDALYEDYISLLTMLGNKYDELIVETGRETEWYSQEWQNVQEAVTPLKVRVDSQQKVLDSSTSPVRRDTLQAQRAAADAIAVWTQNNQSIAQLRAEFDGQQAAYDKVVTWIVTWGGIYLVAAIILFLMSNNILIGLIGPPVAAFFIYSALNNNK
ncbi:MAG: hypothetical protein SGJ27_13185 [Candidatus Melainabacteria bacterium]|nr:hypothetical protein [Candidatus Melainabacteria bacterium]